MVSQNIKHQSGAILVVALMLLLVMTLMGLTSMSITTGELKISSNQQAHNNSYEAALSMLDAVKRSTNIDWLNIDKATPQNEATDNLNAGAGFDSTAVITYVYCIRGEVGNSLTVESQTGDSSASFGRVVQEIVAVGTARGSGQITGTSTMVNGVSMKAASCP